MLITCYSDIHNMLSMLAYPTTLRKTVAMGVDQNLRRFGKADLTVIGGDTISDYPSYMESSWLPQRNFLDLKQKLAHELDRGTKSGKVIYVSGNHDYACGEATKEGYNQAPYNSADYYFTGPMREGMGVLPPEDACIGRSERLGAQAGDYLLGFRYEVNGYDFYCLNFHPDEIYSHQGMVAGGIMRYSEDALIWLKKRLRETDPDGHKPTFVVSHMPIYCSQDPHNRELLLEAYEGHRNIFHLFGDTHDIVKNGFTAQQVFQCYGTEPVYGDTQRTSRDWENQEYSFTSVIMGSQRCDDAYLDDVVPGDPGTDDPKMQMHPRTATPRIAQGLVIETFSDHFEFQICNHGVGLEDGRFTVNEEIQPYTAYFR